MNDKVNRTREWSFIHECKRIHKIWQEHLQRFRRHNRLNKYVFTSCWNKIFCKPRVTGGMKTGQDHQL